MDTLLPLTGWAPYNCIVAVTSHLELIHTALATDIFRRLVACIDLACLKRAPPHYAKVFKVVVGQFFDWHDTAFGLTHLLSLLNGLNSPGAVYRLDILVVELRVGFF